MSLEFSAGSAFSNALQSTVQQKLTELGWLTNNEDTTLYDYILLMLANDKNESEVASELGDDLLDLGPDNPETQQFARWLFNEIHQLREQMAGGGSADQQHPQQAPTGETQMEDARNDAAAPIQDTEMDGVTETSTGNIPTGPKAMRNGSGSKQTARRGGMIGQLNKQMNRGSDESALHRVRGAQGSGRINSHSREPPKGPRNSQNLGRGLDAMANGRGMGNANIGMNGVNVGNMPMGQGGMAGMPGAMPNAGLSHQQQMALMQIYEQQAFMMQQIFSGATPAPFANPNFGGRGGKRFSGTGRGTALGSKSSMPPAGKSAKKDGQDESMADGAAVETTEGMEVETSRPDPSRTMCKFNQTCSKPDCPFVHSSPAAIRGTVVDMNETCSFGVKCMNRKCVGKHPSPAQRAQFQAEQECAFYPNCRDPANCPFKHPTVAACRNGADCTTPGCKFWHSSVMCKYNPCTNIRCPYKHAEGQKQAKSHVWVAPKDGNQDQKEHVSERKFIDESQPEELIIPDKNTEMAEATAA